MSKRILLAAYCLLFLVGCIPITRAPIPSATPTQIPTETFTPFPSPTSTPTHTPLPILVPLILSQHGTPEPTITPPPARKDLYQIPEGWGIEEYELTDATGVNATKYLERHIEELGGEYNIFTGNDYSESYNLEGETLKISVTPHDVSSSLIKATIDEREVLNVDTGPLGNIPCTIMSFWVYEDHWAIEILRRTDAADAKSPLYEDLFVDGKSILDQNHYQWAFSAALIDKKLFYFFQKNGQIGFNYNGIDYLTDYEYIAYACCCWEGMLKPMRFLNGIGFYAERDNKGYFVLLGLIDTK